MLNGKFRAVVVSGLLASSAFFLTGCPEADSAVNPRQPDTSQEYHREIVEAVQGYLKTFKLSESDLAPGTTISWSSGEGSNVGVIKATGNTGPNGHKVYCVSWLRRSTSDSVWTSQEFLEIAPASIASATPAPAPN